MYVITKYFQSHDSFQFRLTFEFRDIALNPCRLLWFSVVIHHEIELVTQISKVNQFVSLGRTTYGDDIKQFFTAVTINGEIYTSEKLDSWMKMASIPLSK